jgi:ribonuclease HI
LKYVLQILWAVSNNEAKYEALLHGLHLAILQGIKRLLVYGDSLLVVQQVNKEWDCNKETMEAYVQEVRKLESRFSGLEVHHVLREHNVGADTLSKLGLTRAQVPPGVFVQELKQPSIKSSPQVTIDAGPQLPDREVMCCKRTGERLLSTSSEIKSYRQELMPEAQRRHASCAEARVLSWSAASSIGAALGLCSHEVRHKERRLQHIAGDPRGCLR